MEKDIKKEILKFLKERCSEPTIVKDIIEEKKFSYPAVTKWLAVLEAEGKIKVVDYGNIKFYYFKNGE